MACIGARRQKEPEDVVASSPASVPSTSSSYASVTILGVKRSGAPLQARIAGEHGHDRFLVAVDEIGLAQAAGAPEGDSSESVLVGGGRAYVVGVTWIGGSADTGAEDEWEHTRSLANARKFCDEGDLDPEMVGIPADAWQLAYGKIVAPLPSEDKAASDSEPAAARMPTSAPAR